MNFIKSACVAIGLLLSSCILTPAVAQQAVVVCLDANVLIESATAALERNDKTVLDKYVADEVCGPVNTGTLMWLEMMGTVKEIKSVVINNQVYTVNEIDDGNPPKLYFLTVGRSAEARD